MNIKLILSTFFLLLSGYLVSAQINPYPVFESEKEDICSRHNCTSHFKSTSSNQNLKHYDITFTKLDIQADNTTTNINGYALIHGTVTALSMNSFVIELGSQMTVDSVNFNETLAEFSHSGDELRITLEESLAKDDVFFVTIYYHGNGNSSSNYAGGIHNQTFDNREIAYTFTQPFGANLWFPCKQDLTDKIDTLYLHITTPSSVKVAANGLLKNTVYLGNNKTRYEWESNHPTAYYLVVLNIFNYTEYSFYAHPEGFSDSILIQNFMIDDTHATNMKDEIDRTNDAMNLYCNLFGFYPFHDEKYGHAIWGHSFGMEHQTLTSMPSNIDFRRLSHELSHQWFGNLVTCASWQDIWLNEGFASFFDYLALKTILSEQDGNERMDYYQSRAMEYPDGSIYVPDKDSLNASRIFNYRLSYCKGAAVVKMLKFELQDDDLFWQSLRNYLEEYKNSSATTEDLKNNIESTSGKELDYFFDQWIYGEGYPIYSGTWYQKNDSLYLNINQTVTKPSITPLFKTKLEFRVRHENGDSLIILSQDKSSQTHKVYLPQEVHFLQFDPNKEILAQNEGFTRTNKTEGPTIDAIQVFPNVFNCNIYIKNNTDSIITFQGALIDINGNVVAEFRTTDNFYNIETNQLNSGVYFLKISSMYDTEIYRLVKN